jgi:hypothetical protein
MQDHVSRRRQCFNCSAICHLGPLFSFVFAGCMALPAISDTTRPICNRKRQGKQSESRRANNNPGCPGTLFTEELCVSTLSAQKHSKSTRNYHSQSTFMLCRFQFLLAAGSTCPSRMEACDHHLLSQRPTWISNRMTLVSKPAAETANLHSQHILRLTPRIRRHLFECLYLSNLSHSHYI